jgi:ferredoxin-NADP reductase
LNETTDQTGRWQGTRTFVVEKKMAESKTVTSFILRPEDGGPLAAYKPGQFLGFRLDIPGQPKPVARNYTLSDSPSSASRGDGACYRLSIKREPAPKDRPGLPPGLSSNYFHDHVQVGTRLKVLAPSGDFFLHEDRDGGELGPVALLSGGVGLTPMISMLNHIVHQGAKRPVWFIHGVQNGDEHAFGAHVRGLADTHENVSAHIVYVEPGPRDVQDRDYDAEGFITIPMVESLGPGPDADFYLCGPPPFMKALFNALLGWGVDESRIYYEFFGPASVLKDDAKDGGGEAKAPARETAAPANGMTVTFKRSGVTVPWDPAKDNILELAEANGVIADFSCRSGVCHTCMCELIEGEVEYVNDDAMLPDDESQVLICSSVPKTDVTIDV